MICYCTVPTPTVTSTLSKQSDILAGSTLNITCTTTLDPKVNTPVTIVTKWTKQSNNIETNGRLIVNDAVHITDTNQYQSILTFTTLSSTEDSGNYQCTITVQSDANYSYVMNSNSSNQSLSIAVTGKQLNFITK